MEWQAAEASALPESVGVPPAALSRSKGGFDGALVPLEASGHGRRHGFWARTGLCGDGMAITL